MNNLTLIAQKAKVSIMTVSRAANPATRHKVAPKTLALIDRLMHEYAYTPSTAARSLRQKKTGCIGVAIPHMPGVFYSPYYAHVLAGVSDYLKGTEYRFKLLMLDEGDERWNRYDFRAGEGVDALVVVHWFKIFSDASVFKNIDIPFAIVNDYDPAIAASFVAVDQESGGRQVAEYLSSSGHRHVGVIAGPDWSLDSAQRVRGFLSAAKKLGCTVKKDHVVTGDYLEPSGYAGMTKMLHAGSLISAVFCANDQMAYGAMRCLRDRGLRCPEDVSIVGFDDDPISAQINPALTTVSVPVYAMAQKAVELLISSLTQKEAQAIPTDFFKPSLVPRSSVSRR